MKNVIEILNTYYQSFINKKRDWHFFLELADYVKYAVETPETDNILKGIVQARNNDERRLKKYEKEVIKETKQAKDRLSKVIKKHKISYESLDRAIEEYQGYESGRIQSSRTDAEALSDALMDIIRSLFKNGHKQLVKDFAIEHKEVPNEIGKYTFSKTLDLYENEREIFNDKMKTELWASWDNLALAYLAVFKVREKLKKLRKDEKNFYTAWNFVGLAGEMKKIRDGDINRLTGIASDFEPIHFKRENYISHASRVHNYLIKELNLQIAEKEEHKEPVELFTNEVIPDRTEEIQRQMDEARIRATKEMREEKRHKELIKQQRILATKIDKYSHALDLIIERAEYSGNGNNFSIEFYDFNFEKMIGSRMLEKFLTELQKDSCFEKYTRTNYAGGTRFGFIKPSVKKLKAFKEKRGKQETKTSRSNEEVLETEQLLDKLESDINESARAIEKPAEYENGILKFRGKEIDFRNKQNQKELLTTLFEETKKNWSYDEIQDKWDEMMKSGLVNKPKDYWKKFYSAGDGISKTVAIETQIKDFIIKNTKEIRINPKYI